MAGCLQGTKISTLTLGLGLQSIFLPWNQKPSKPQRCPKSCFKPETQNAWLLKMQRENLKALETLAEMGLSGLSVFHMQRVINQPEPPQLSTGWTP